jgi:hypothetical protein
MDKHSSLLQKSTNYGRKKPGMDKTAVNRFRPVPEVVVKSGRVLEPEDVDVSGEDDAVEKEHQLHRHHVLHRELRTMS